MGQEASLPVDGDELLEEQAKAPPSSIQPNSNSDHTMINNNKPHHTKPHKLVASMFQRPQQQQQQQQQKEHDYESRESIRAGVSSGNVYHDRTQSDDFQLQKMIVPKPKTAASKLVSSMKNLSLVRQGNNNKQNAVQEWEQQWDEDEDSDEEEEELPLPPAGTTVRGMELMGAAAKVPALFPKVPSVFPKVQPAELLPHREQRQLAVSPPDLHQEWEHSERSKPNVDMFLPMLRVLGKGSFGKVVLVQKREGKEQGALFAMKILKKTHLVKRRQIERTRTERKVLSVVNHPFIMKLHYAFQSPDKLYLVLDYCPGGELFFHLSRFRRFPERVARFYAAELLLAIGHLHKRGIIYRDLKPENVLLDAEGHVKLGDFGLAKAGVTHPCEGATSMCGTPEYMAPEVLAQQGHGFCVDYWGLGMIVYEMMTGLPPWYTTDRQQLFRRLKSAPLDIPSYFSPASADCVSHLLQRNPRRRLGVDGIRVAMEHEFFRNIRWRALYSRTVEAPVRPCEGWKGETDAESLELATQNFDAQFTRMPVDSEDTTPYDSNEEKELMSELDENTFLGFSFDIVKDREAKDGTTRSRTQNFHATADGA